VYLSRQRARRSDFCLSLSLIAALAIGFGVSELRAQDGVVEAGQALSTTCAACHGIDGNSVTPEWPSLAGQHAKYTARQLQAFKDGERSDAGMQQFAATLSEQDMRDIGVYYATQSIASKGANSDLVEHGERIYRGGIPEREIAACIACHGPGGKGNPLAGYPAISHQHTNYLSATLRAYQVGERRSDATLNQMMRNIAELLLDDEIEALASYMQGLE